jgi:magnesium transporter
MQPADAAQVIEELPEEQAEKVLDLMKEQQSEDVQELLEYGEKTAGRIMSPEVLAIHEYATWPRPSSTCGRRPAPSPRATST